MVVAMITGSWRYALIIDEVIIVDPSLKLVMFKTGRIPHFLHRFEIYRTKDGEILD